MRSHYQIPVFRNSQTSCSKSFLSCCLQSTVNKFDILPESTDANQKSQMKQEENGNEQMKGIKKLGVELKTDATNDDHLMKNMGKENVENTEKMSKWYLLKQLLAPSPEPIRSTGRVSQEYDEDDNDEDDDGDQNDYDEEDDDEKNDDDSDEENDDVEDKEQKGEEEDEEEEEENQKKYKGKKLKERKKEGEEKENEERKKDEENRKEKRNGGLNKKKGNLRSSLRNRRLSKLRRGEKLSSHKKQRRRHFHGRRKNKSKQRH